jgi:hypothetical protein
MSKQRGALGWVLATVLLAGLTAALYGIVFELARSNPGIVSGSASGTGLPGGLAGVVAVPVVAVVAALVTLSLIRRGR